MREYPDRAPYVHARVDPGGATLATLTFAGMDPSDMHGYGELWAVPADPAPFPVPANTVVLAVAATVGALLVPRIEPHIDPPRGIPEPAYSAVFSVLGENR